MLWKTALHAPIPEKLEFKQEVVQRPVIRRGEEGEGGMDGEEEGDYIPIATLSPPE